MVSSVDSPTHTTRIGRHLWEIDLIFAPGLPSGWVVEGGSCCLHGAIDSYMSAHGMLGVCILGAMEVMEGDSWFWVVAVPGW